ncbi:Leucine-rich repeat-containing protein 29, partial [Cladochytrium tenue]
MPPAMLLPPEVLALVLGRLDVRARCRCCCACRAWRDAAYAAAPARLWPALDLSARHHAIGGDKFFDGPASPDAFAHRLVAVLSSSVSASSSITGAGAATGGNDAAANRDAAVEGLLTTRILRFSSLVRLDVSCTAFDPHVFEAFPDVAYQLGGTLQQLVLSGCPLVASGSITYLRHLRALRLLDVSHCDGVDDAGVDAVAAFVPWVRSLNLAYLFKITDAAVRRLFRLPGLESVNLMGCCRIKSYFWAMAEAGVTRPTTFLREISTGEDTRIQTRGFWLLWCTWQAWRMDRLGQVCPFLETLRLNIVMLDFPTGGLELLFECCPRLKHLSLVADRTVVQAMCSVAPQLRQLQTLELTMHIGVTADQLTALVDADALLQLRALKFHSKHASLFTDSLLAAFAARAPHTEYLELNAEAVSPRAFERLPAALGGSLQSLLLHHLALDPAAAAALAPACGSLKELTISDLQPVDAGAIAVSASARANAVVSPRRRDAGRSARPPACRPRPCSLALLVPVGSPMATRLKKIELLSYRGFSDKDLAAVPRACPNLQWIDFTFSFSFPKTTGAIARSCSNLLYLRLCRWSPPSWMATSATTAVGAAAAAVRRRRLREHQPASASVSPASAPASAATARTPELNSPLTTSASPQSRGCPSPAAATANATSRTGRRHRHSFSAGAPPPSPRSPGPFLASLLAASSSSSNPPPAPPPPQTPPPSPSAGTAAPPANHPQATTATAATAAAATTPEARAFHALATGPAGRRLRVLDLAGALGVSDAVLEGSLAHLPRLHTL